MPSQQFQIGGEDAVNVSCNLRELHLRFHGFILDALGIDADDLLLRDS